jgi:hypothetical protein
MTAEARGTPAPQTRRLAGRERAVNLYELLEVSPQAGQPVIQAAYRALARQMHPDTHPEVADGVAEWHIRQLNAAYRVLSDPRARAQYDYELANKRRAERIINADQSAGVATVGGPASRRPPRSYALRPRSTIKGAEDQFIGQRATTALVLLVVAGFTVLSLLLVWNSLDPPQNDVRDYAPARVQLAQH